MSSTVMSKPREFAHLLRHKFGSADDLTALNVKDSKSRGNTQGSASLPRENQGLVQHQRRKPSFDTENKRRCISDDGHRSERSPSVGTSADISEEAKGETASSPHPSPARCADGENDVNNQGDEMAEWKAVMQELILHKEEVDHLREEMDEMRHQFKQEIEAVSDQLREERDRYERLEEQMNDLTELHQHEIENIKSVVNDMEEKVQYQSEERLLETKEHLQSLETKVTSIEHQQAQQQYLNIEGLDTTDARAVMMKFLTAIITVIHVFLFFVGTIMSLVRPFFSSTPKAAVSVALLAALLFLYHEKETIYSFVDDWSSTREEVQDSAEEKF